VGAGGIFKIGDRGVGGFFWGGGRFFVALFFSWVGWVLPIFLGVGFFPSPKPRGFFVLLSFFPFFGEGGWFWGARGVIWGGGFCFL